MAKEHPENPVKIDTPRTSGEAGKTSPEDREEVTLSLEGLRQVIGKDNCWKDCYMADMPPERRMDSMEINGKEAPNEMLARALACETPEELVKLAREFGIEITKEQAQVYLEEMDEVDLSTDQLKQVAGGGSWTPPTCGTLNQTIS